MFNFDESINDFYDNPLFKITKRYLCLIGRWPYQSIQIRVIILFAMSIGFFTILIPQVRNNNFSTDIRSDFCQKIFDK